MGKARSMYADRDKMPQIFSLKILGKRSLGRHTYWRNVIHFNCKGECVCLWTGFLWHRPMAIFCEEFKASSVWPSVNIHSHPYFRIIIIISSSITLTIKSKEMRCVRHVAGMQIETKDHKFSVLKILVKRSLGRHKCWRNVIHFNCKDECVCVYVCQCVCVNWILVAQTDGGILWRI